MNQKLYDWRGVIILAVFLFAGLPFLIFYSLNNSRVGGNYRTPTPTPIPSRTIFENSNAPPRTPLGNSATNTPTPPPSPTATNTPSPEINTADRIRAAMPDGNVVYDPPASMNLEDTKLVNLILGPGETVSQLEAMIPDKTGRQILSDKIKWYGYMQADMSGTDFDITLVTPAKQLVSKQDVTKWSWSVKAKKPGKQTLYLTLYAIVNEDGVEKPFVIRPFDPKVIEVDVTFYQKAGLFLTAAGSHMEWILTAIIGLVIPFALWVIKHKKGEADDISDSEDKELKDKEAKENEEVKAKEEIKEDEKLKDGAKPVKPKKEPNKKPPKP